MEAEAVALLGLLSSIDIFLRDGENFIQNLDSLRSGFFISQALKPFESAKRNLKLIVDRIKTLDGGEKFLSKIEAERRKSATNVVDLCTQQLRLLTGCLQIMTKTSWRRKKRVVRWFGKNEDIDISIKTLVAKTRELIQLLAFLNNTNHDPARKLSKLLFHLPNNTKQHPARRMPEPCTMVPFVRNPVFIGRKDIIHSIESKFQVPWPKVVLVGPEGIGKTEICIEYSYRYRESDPDSWVFWINGADIWGSYLEIARRLQLGETTGLLDNVARWMRDPKNGPWLAILDDFDFDGTNINPGNSVQGDFSRSEWEQHFKDIWSYAFDTKRSLILVTSNNFSSWPQDATKSLEQSVVLVPQMIENEAVELLLSYFKGQTLIESSEATKIISQIGFHPPEIRKAALYIEATETRNFDYLNDIRSIQAVSQQISEDARCLESGEDGAVPPNGYHSVGSIPHQRSMSIDDQTSVLVSAENCRADILNASSFIAKTLLSDPNLKVILEVALFSHRLPEKEERLEERPRHILEKLRHILEKFSRQTQALARGSTQVEVANFLRKHHRTVAFGLLQESASEKRADANTNDLLRRGSLSGSGRLGEVLASFTDLRSTKNYVVHDLKPTNQFFYQTEIAKSFITKDSPYFNLVDSIYMNIATPPRPQDITKFVSSVLENSAKLVAKSTGGYQPAIFFVDWELSTFMQEFDQIPRLGEILVISGFLANAQATTVEEYISHNWPKGGIPVLRALENMHKSSETEAACFDVKSSNVEDHQEHGVVEVGNSLGSEAVVEIFRNSTIEHPENQPQISVQGTPPIQAEAAATISWLAAAIRHSDIIKLAGSKSSLTYIPSKTGLHFRVQSLKLEPVGESQSCWHSLFRHAVVALDYPIAQRREGIGLDISFSAMTSLARTDWIVKRQDGFLFRGLKWMLIPTRRLRHDLDRAVQWHLIKVSDMGPFFEAKNQWVKLKSKRMIHAYTAKRAFLGWCDNVSINVATQNASYDIQYSSARTKKRRLNPTTIAFPISIGVKGSSIGITTILQISPRQDQTYFDLANDIKDRLAEKLNSHLVIYDSATERAWMLPYLNVLLHLAHMRAAILSRKSHENTDSQLLPPYAVASGDKAEAAHHAMIPLVSLSNAKRREESTARARGPQDPETTRAEKVVEYLECLIKGLDEAHKKFRELTDSDVDNTRAKRRIYGFELIDIARGETEPSFKEHTLRYTSGTWPLMVREQGVFFCRGIGHAIAPANECAQMPDAHDYLGALVFCLSALQEKRGDYENIGILTHDKKWRWEPTAEYSTAGETQQSRGCFHTAQLIKNDSNSKKASLLQNLIHHEEGAFVFGTLQRWSHQKHTFTSWKEKRTQSARAGQDPSSLKGKEVVSISGSVATSLSLYPRNEFLLGDDIGDETNTSACTSHKSRENPPEKGNAQDESTLRKHIRRDESLSGLAPTKGTVTITEPQSPIRKLEDMWASRANNAGVKNNGQRSHSM